MSLFGIHALLDAAHTNNGAAGAFGHPESFSAQWVFRIQQIKISHQFGFEDAEEMRKGARVERLGASRMLRTLSLIESSNSDMKDMPK